MKKESERRSIFERYIGEISTACNAITGVDPKKLYDALLKQAESKTEEADQFLDDEGKVIDGGGRLAKDDDVIILDDRQTGPSLDDENTDLFGDKTKTGTRRKTTAKKKTRSKKKTKR